MKKFNKVLTRSAVALTLAALLPSCAMDQPFGDGGEGNLTLTTEINGNVKRTRALEGDELAALREKCVVYIETEQGVIRKFKGLDNIPQSIRLKTGNYLAEAWSGDSVSASFDAKFYRGKQEFAINEGENSLTLKCNIANVLVSVDPSSLQIPLKDLKVTFSHSRGSLEFNESNISEETKGYFMMPNADKDIAYVIEGVKEDGSAYTREGKIENVQRAHEYCMKISADSPSVTDGGAWIRLVIEDIPLIEETVEIFDAPVVRGVEFDMNEQVVSTDRNFQDTKVYVRGFFGLSSLRMTFSDNFGIASYDNILDGSAISELEGRGIHVERKESTDAAENGTNVKVDEVYITFGKTFLDALEPSALEYTVTFDAVDENRKENSGTLRIANDEAALEVPAPVATAPAPDSASDPLAIAGGHATLTGMMSAEATGFGIKYRPQGESDWQVAYPSSAAGSQARRALRGKTRAAEVPYTVVLTGLTPGTVYEYKAFCDGYDKCSVYTFKTEDAFALPGSSFEEWSTYEAQTLLGKKNVILPWPVGDKEASFWGSGNEGSATANMTLTNKSTDMAHSGSFSTRMESKSAMGMLAAGNLFVGTYVKTDGTNGVLSLGRPYNGSHPTKVRVWANYRPGSNVSIKSGNEQYVEIVAGGTDEGQIYVALTDGPVEVRTNPDNRKLFSADDPQVIAYGQITWKSDFGPDGQLQLLEIPFEYNERAKTTVPSHIVITCAASKWGDYFSGATGSTMYVDDFEFVYE